MVGIKKCFESITESFNSINQKLILNDNENNEVNITCNSTLSVNNYLLKFDQLSSHHKIILNQNTNLKSQLVKQSCEYKKLKDNQEQNKIQIEKAEVYEERISCLQKTVEDNKIQMEKMMEEGEKRGQQNFEKDRIIDKLRH